MRYIINFLLLLIKYILIVLPISTTLFTILPLLFFINLLITVISISIYKYKKKYNSYELLSYIPPQTIYIYILNITCILAYNMSFTTIYRVLHVWKNYRSRYGNAYNIKFILYITYTLLKRLIVTIVFSIPVILQAWAWYILTNPTAYSYKNVLDTLLSKITITHQHREKPAIYIRAGIIYLNGVPPVK